MEINVKEFDKSFKRICEIEKILLELKEKNQDLPTEAAVRVAQEVSDFLKLKIETMNDICTSLSKECYIFIGKDAEMKNNKSKMIIDCLLLVSYAVAMKFCPHDQYKQYLIGRIDQISETEEHLFEDSDEK